MFEGKWTNRYLWIFIFTVFGALFVFACIAWFERVNSDAGYYIFKTINQRFFQIEHGRYVLACSQILPLLGIWMHLSLKAVLILYSVNHVLFFIILAFVTWKISKKMNGPLVITLLSFCGLRESVYTPQFELYYGLGFLVLFMVLFQKWTDEKMPGFLRVCKLIFVAIMTVSSHPMALILLFFAVFIYALSISKFYPKIWIGIFIFLLVYYFWKKFTASEYESGKFAWYWLNIKNGEIWSVFKPARIGTGVNLLVKFYNDVLLLLIGISILLMHQKQYRVLFIYLFCFVFFLLSVWMIYPPSQSIDRYLEQIYYPMVFAVFIPLLFMERLKRGLLFLLVYTLIFRTTSIYESYQKFALRTEKMDQLITEASNIKWQKEQRFIVYKKNMGEDAYNEANWSYGFETMMRSAITKGYPISITKDEDYFASKNDSMLKAGEYLFTFWSIENTSTLNPYYFKMKAGHYLYLFPDRASLLPEEVRTQNQ